jgi:predicted membrane protein
MTSPSKTIQSAVLRLSLGLVLAGVASRLLSKRMTSGDEETDEFRIASIIGGTEFSSRAANLRSGSILALVGGSQIDLRQASLDAAGATLTAKAIVGGIQVLVRPDWAVHVESHGVMGGIDQQVTGPADLPDDAPSLRVTATTWLGGIQITNAPQA